MDAIFEFIKAFLLAAVTTGEPSGAQVTGRPYVSDGDSLRFRETRVRLHAIDALEGGQTCKKQSGRLYPCGVRSRDRLRSVIGSQKVSCHVVDEDRYGRLVAKCYVGQIDVGAEMVRSGMAVAYTDYGWDYAWTELKARRNEVGIWSGTFEMPQDWRKARR